MGCAPSSGSRVSVQPQVIAAEQNNNHRISMDNTNYNKTTESTREKPVAADIYGAELSEGDEDDPDTVVYGANLPDHVVKKAEILVPVITHSSKTVSFVENEGANSSSSSSSSSASSLQSTSHRREPQDKLTEELLNEFIELDREIQKLEAEHTEEKLTLHQLEYTNLETALKEKQKELGELKEKIDDDVDLNCSLYMQKFSLMSDTDLNTERMGDSELKDLDNLKAINQVEVCEKQLEALKEKLHNISEAVEKSLKEVDTLTSKRLKLNGLLENVFNGEYGSELENRLELETDQLLQYKQHVSVAHFKWWNGRVLINHGVSQMAVACKQWKGVKTIIQQTATVITEEKKYELATDVRNNLVAAHQNCVRTQEYLQMQLPYWTHADNQNMLDRIQRLYNDLLSIGTYENAYAWYYYFHQRLGLQLNWMDQVINSKIVTDYNRVSSDFKTKYRELRKERLTLLQEKVKAILNIEWDIEPFLKAHETELDESDTLPSVGQNEQQASTSTSTAVPSAPVDDTGQPDYSQSVVVNENESPRSPDHRVATPEIPPPEINNSTSGDESGTVNNVEGEAKQAPPKVRRLSLSELAPTPSDNELFGNLQQMEATHRKQMEDLDKIQELNKAKQEQGLKEKLRERQSKRRKQQLQQIQATALADVST